jgi:hypothetical protein
MLFSSGIILAVAGLSSVVGAQRGSCRDYITCIDGVNSCGGSYSGCYNTCEPSNSPKPGPCKTTSKPPPVSTTKSSIAPSTTSKYSTSTIKSTTKPTSVPTLTTVTKSSSSECVHLTRCDDYIDPVCSQWYGGCWDICSPSPTWSKPSCSLTTQPPSTTKKSSSSACVHQTMCADYLDSCGHTYGGCYDICSPEPSWSTSDCTLTN